MVMLSILSLFWDALRTVVRDARGLRASGLGPVVEGIYQGGLDVGYYLLRWPIPRDPPRRLMLALMDACTLGVLLVGPLAYVAFVTAITPGQPSVRWGRLLFYALLPSFVWLLFNATLLRGILASRLQQEGPR
jgi:hypothetical protein